MWRRVVRDHGDRQKLRDDGAAFGGVGLPSQVMVGVADDVQQVAERAERDRQGSKGWALAASGGARSGTALSARLPIRRLP